MAEHEYLSTLSRAQLAQLGREYMLAAQFNSRTGYAALRINHGDEAYLDTAIDNWMAVSPIYTQRMQRAMKLNTGSDIATILKGMQLECGLSHQYFDAGFEEISESEGQFWLNRCGPLLETEPRGEEAVKTMCHAIEDPTFDATAVATNPRARVRPVHRPPRPDGASGEHCRWRISIDAANEPIVEPAITRVMRKTQLAGVELTRPPSAEEGGADYYDGAVYETLDLERFSQAALVVICKELAVQFHLLLNALSLAVAQRYGAEAARAIAQFQMVGSTRVISERLSRWAGEEEAPIDSVIGVLRAHPALNPVEYIRYEIERIDDSTATITFEDCPALNDDSSTGQALGWFPLLKQGVVEGLLSLVQGVNPAARVIGDANDPLRWRIAIDESAETEDDPLSVQIAKGTVLYTTQLEDKIALLTIEA
ncbi:MAG: hypothetical protein AB8C02_02080 [Halioglobus sp.]